MSGFLDNILAPGDAAEIAVKRELAQRRDSWSKPGYHYKGAGDFLLQHGRFYRARKLPDQYAPLSGPEANCYENALVAAEADPTLRYCEGVFAVVGLDFHGHAWCVDPDDQVVELTLPTESPEQYRSAWDGLPFLPLERWGYFGAIINTEYARAHRTAFAGRCALMLDISPTEKRRQLDHGTYGEDIDHPLLRHPFDPNRRTL